MFVLTIALSSLIWAFLPLFVTVASVHQGDLVISNADDLAAAVAAGYEAVAGNLTISNTDLVNLDGLETIRTITGGLTIADNANLTSIAGLDGATSVWKVRIEDNPMLSALELTGVTSVPAGVTVSTPMGGGAPISFPALEHLGNSLLWGYSTEVSLPALQDVAGFLRLVFPTAKSISLPSLRCVWADLVLSGDELESFSAPALDSLGTCNGKSGYPYYPQGFELTKVPKLASLDLPNLTFVAHTLRITWTSLTAIDLPSLTGGVDNVDIVGGPMTSLSLPALHRVSQMHLSYTSNLETVDIPLAEGTIDIHDNAALRTLRMGFTNGFLDVHDNAALQTLDLPEFTSRGRLTVENSPALGSLALPALQLSDGLNIINNATLQSFSAPSLSTIATLRFRGNPQLQTLDVPSLRTFSAVLEISGSALQNLGGLSGVRSGLVTVNSDPGLLLSDNSALTDISGLAGLGDDKGADPIVTGGAKIMDNPLLSAAAVQALLDALEAKYPGSAFPDGVTTSGNGG